MPDNITDYEVTIQHYRVPQELYDVLDVPFLLEAKSTMPKGVTAPYHKSDPQFKPAPRGGMTVVTLENEHGSGYRGYAWCSLVDGFNYQRGAQIAYGRILAYMGGRDCDHVNEFKAAED